MTAQSKTIRRFELKLSINAWYRWILVLILVLAALLSVSNRFLMSTIKEINLELTMFNTYFQDRELHLSRFYNSVNKDYLIRELYDVTLDKKYLIALRENSVLMVQEFDSLHKYCLEDESYCTRLDSVKYCLDLYVELLIPQYELAHQTIHDTSVSSLNLTWLNMSGDSVDAKGVTLDPADQEKIWELLNHNYQVLMDRIVKPAGKIVSMDRDNTIIRRVRATEQISSLHLWQKATSILTLAFVVLLVFVLAYILIRPLEKPRPLFSRLPDQNYVTAYPGFETELTMLLEQHQQPFRKYKGLILVFPRGGLFPGEITRVFRDFCEIHHLPYKQTEELHPGDVNQGQAFMILEDNTLAAFVEITAEKGLIIGKETGVLSYGDSPLRRIVANGITVIENIQDDCTSLGSRIGKTASGHCLRFIERESL
ncbi:MAG: hypothetical protein V2B15_05580 [Bacteroidota bacterium]